MQPIGQDTKCSPTTFNHRIDQDHPEDASDLPRSPSQQSLESTKTYTTAYSTFCCESLSMKQGNLQGLSGEEPIIAVMGPTGAGKSTFIKVATGSDDVKIGDDLFSCTKESQLFRCHNPLDNCDVLFVDTPGFDDTFRPDIEILQGIADWLEKTYQAGIKLSGILYLHRITDNRMSNTLLRNLGLFRRLCGDDALSNIRLVTTCWDLLPDEDQGKRIEKELCDKYWKPFIKSGAQVHRFEYTCASAWGIVGSLPMERRPIQIQKEIVDQNKPLLFTAAGQTLFSSATQVLRELISWLEGMYKRVTSLSSDAPHIEEENKLNEAREELHRMESLSRKSSNWRRPASRSNSLHSSIESTLSAGSSSSSFESPLKLRRRVRRLRQRDTTPIAERQDMDTPVLISLQDSAPQHATSS